MQGPKKRYSSVTHQSTRQVQITQRGQRLQVYQPNIGYRDRFDKQ
jgi:hypothetical protein